MRMRHWTDRRRPGARSPGWPRRNSPMARASDHSAALTPAVAVWACRRSAAISLQPSENGFLTSVRQLSTMWQGRGPPALRQARRGENGSLSDQILDRMPPHPDQDRCRSDGDPSRTVLMKRMRWGAGVQIPPPLACRRPGRAETADFAAPRHSLVCRDFRGSSPRPEQATATVLCSASCPQPLADRTLRFAYGARSQRPDTLHDTSKNNPWNHLPRPER